MTNFLRKIRKNLLPEGNFKAYLIYALGEIFLIVIGIMIAININNWNENRKNDKMNQQFLYQLKDEIGLNYNSIIVDKEYRDTLDLMIYNFHKFLSQQNIEEDSSKLKNYLSTIMRSTTYSFTNTNIKNFVNSNINSDSELVKELIQLDVAQENLQAFSEKALDFKIAKFYDYLSEDVDFTDLSIHNYDKLNTLQFRNNISLVESIEEELYNLFELTYLQQEKLDSMIQIEIRE